MSLSATVVDAVVGDKTSVLHNHRDWIICLFATRKFGKNQPRSEKQSDMNHIRILCETTTEQQKEIPL